MAYKSKSIKETILDIESNKVYLPALQRKFVWAKPQIELLFDSIMRNYPIGTFLFWNLKRAKANEYVFYNFLKKYDERHPYNIRKTGVFLNEEITGVLDGQQRLSSLYIGLQGTHTSRTHNKHRDKDDSYPEMKLFLNILSLPFLISLDNLLEVNDEVNFEFKFLSTKDSENWIERKSRINSEEGLELISEEVMYWFRVGEVLSWGEDPEYDLIIEDLIKRCISDDQKKAIVNSRRQIRKALETLFKRVSNEQLISYFEITKDDLEDILKIFIRVNSGGTQLSKTDLLFSTIVATWDDGREEIEELLQKVNKKGDGFNFTNEYLMRCCLVLTDAPVLYKVHSFKSENVQRIKDNWGKIALSLEKTVGLLVDFGFSRDLLTSLNSTIVIAYYIYKGGILNVSTVNEIKKYLIHSLLRRIYSSSQDQLISTFRNALRKSDPSVNGGYCLKSSLFSFDQLLGLELPSGKSLRVTELELDALLAYKKGASSFFVLSLLYPHLKYKEIQFHQDHIHPASGFSDETFKSLGLSEEECSKWLSMRDMIPNLQLMEGRENESKNASEFLVWLSRKSASDQDHFKVINYIPIDETLIFASFVTFFEKRKTKLKDELRKVLAIDNNVDILHYDTWDHEIEFEEFI